MGASNATAVVYSWSHLNLAPRLLLVHMALTAYDPPGLEGKPPCLYWASWERQAEAMGYEPNESARRRLMRLRGQLVAAGAIELDARGTRVSSTRWLLHPLRAEPAGLPLPWLSGDGGSL